MATDPEHVAAEATAVAVRFELNEASRRLARARADESAELDRVAALCAVGTRAGVGVEEIADRVGVSREALLDAGTSGRGGAERNVNVDARLACALGAGEAKSEQALIEDVAHAPTSADDVSAALERLVETGDARPVSAGISGDGAAPRYRLTAHGAARLPGRLRQATMSPAREWIVSVASTPTEAGAIVRAADLLLGRHEVSVIAAGTRSDMRAPELAWRVEASEPENAIQAAIDRMRELRGDIDGLRRDEPVVVTALAHPHDAHRGC
jgi:hypothetical protein